MMENFTLKLADRIIETHTRYSYCMKQCRDYLAEATRADIIAETTDEAIEEMRGELEGLSCGYAEHLCIYRSIAEQLPFHNRMVFHGAVISCRGDGYLFTAPSGTGKTTHISLWKKYLGENVDIVNGDKPILSVEEHGGGSLQVTAWGTPWAGKENWQKNCSAPVKGICFLEQSREKRIFRLRPEDCILRLMRQVYLPSDERAAGRTLELLDKMISFVPLYLLKCDISEEAVRVSFEALTGLGFSRGRDRI